MEIAQRVPQVRLSFSVSLLVIGSVPNLVIALIVILKGFMLNKFGGGLFCLKSTVYGWWVRSLSIDRKLMPYGDDIILYRFDPILSMKNYYLSREHMNELLF